MQAWGIALSCGGLAFFLYRRVFPARRGQPLPQPLAFARSLSWNKFYVDELYQALLLRPLGALARAAYKVVDAILIDTVGVRGAAWVTMRTGAFLPYAQTGDAQTYAAVMAAALAAGLLWVLFRFTVTT